MNMSKRHRYVFDELESSQRAALVANFGNLLSHYNRMPKRSRNSLLMHYISEYGANKIYAYWLSYKKFAQSHKGFTNIESSNFEAIRHFIMIHQHIGSDLPHNTTDLEPIASMLESLHERISVLEAKIPTH